MSIKWLIVLFAAFVVVSIGAGFVKGAIQQRKINKEIAKNRPPEEPPSEKESPKKKPDQKPKKKAKKKPDVKRPKRLVNGSTDKTESEKNDQ